MWPTGWFSNLWYPVIVPIRWYTKMVIVPIWWYTKMVIVPIGWYTKTVIVPNQRDKKRLLDRATVFRDWSSGCRYWGVSGVLIKYIPDNICLRDAEYVIGVCMSYMSALQSTTENRNVSLSSLEEVVEQEEEQAVDPELRSQPVRCNCTNHSAEPKYFSAWIFWIIFNESTARCSRSTSRFLCMLVSR